MNARHNHPLFPITGNSSSAFQIGLAEDVDARYVRYMDSWDALRRNLTALMDAAQDGLRSGPTGVLQLEAVTGVGKSTLYRILDSREKNPTQLDTLEKIAAAYNLQAWQLIVPRLDPLDPPAVIGSQRMAVMRSVFAQVTLTANEQLPQPPQPGPQGAGPSNPRHRNHSSEESDDGAAPAIVGRSKRGRPRATKKG